MRINNNTLRTFGAFDNKSRFEITDSRVGSGNHCTLTGATLRMPSAAWPFSVWNHLKTQKFAKAALAAGLVNEGDLIPA